jgi:hypothetical protein
MKYLFTLIILISCSKDPMSFDPRITISKELIRFFYEESKEQPVME